MRPQRLRQPKKPSGRDTKVAGAKPKTWLFDELQLRWPPHGPVALIVPRPARYVPGVHSEDT